jgi:hypothetical protein
MTSGPLPNPAISKNAVGSFPVRSFVQPRSRPDEHRTAAKGPMPQSRHKDRDRGTNTFVGHHAVMTIERVAS